MGNIQLKDGKPLGGPQNQPPTELKPLAPAKFYDEPLDSEVEFTPQPGGNMRMKVAGRGMNAEGDRVTIAPFDSKDLPQYPGAYWSDELETQYTIVAKDGKLVADHAHHGEIALTPVAKDQFRGGTFFMQEVNFLRDAAGRVNAMTIGDRKSTRLNSSHQIISYAVFCLKKKK